MDESERKVDSQAPGGAPRESEASGTGTRGPEPESARTVGVVEIAGPQDAPAGWPSTDVQKGEPPRVQPKVKTSLKRLPHVTDRQRELVAEYLSNGKNKAFAYAKIYNKSLQTKNLRQHAHKMFNSPSVRKLLDISEQHVNNKLARVFEKYAINEERIAEELAKVAFSDPTQVMSWDNKGVNVKSSEELSDDVKGTIAEVKNTPMGVQVRQHDKINALLSLGKSMGMFQGDEKKVDNRVAVQFVIKK